MYQNTIEIDNKPIKELMKTEEGQIKLIREAAYKKANSSLKTENVKDFSDSTLENDKFKEYVARYKSQGFIKKIGEEKGSKHSENIQKKAEEIGIIEIAKTNSGLLRLPYSSGGQAVFDHWKIKNSGEKAEIEKILKKKIEPSDSLSKEDINKIIEVTKAIKPEQINIKEKQTNLNQFNRTAEHKL